jgi:NAD(P)-dependent dehydrogenase (short-subunit alcohol dehydrogenase family)
MGKTALVTGGGRGIGRGIALALGARSWRVVVNYARDREAAEETLTAVRTAGGEGIAVQADIGRGADRDRLVAETMAHYGRIDLLVNNAGVAPKQRVDLLEMGEESYERVMDTNLKGPFFLTQQVAKVMVERVQSDIMATPQIVNISSISAYTSSTDRGEYCLSKAGMGMMTALFADRLAQYGIAVFEIRPGVIATDMTAGVQEKYDRLFEAGLAPINRWGQPEDVAKVVVAIAEGYFPYSTGEVFNVDGGFHLRRL